MYIWPFVNRRSFSSKCEDHFFNSGVLSFTLFRKKSLIKRFQLLESTSFTPWHLRPGTLQQPEVKWSNNGIKVTWHQISRQFFDQTERFVQPNSQLSATRTKHTHHWLRTNQDTGASLYPVLFLIKHLVLSHELKKVELPPWKINTAHVSSVHRSSAFLIFQGGSSTFINSVHKTKIFVSFSQRRNTKAFLETRILCS